MKLSIFTTATDPILRGDLWYEAIDNYCDLADEVIVINGGDRLTHHNPKVKIIDFYWPNEFSWEFIGQQFQRGYEACTGDWTIRMDLDFIFHEKDFGKIHAALQKNDHSPGLTFWKYQFIRPYHYSIKSRLVLGVNKRDYGNQIKFDSGGDLCAPSLRGEYLDPGIEPEARVAVWNYECLLKEERMLREDKGRMARAWQRKFGEYKLGGPDEESAFDKWLTMVNGRVNKELTETKITDHPKVMQTRLRSLTPEQFGYNMWRPLNA